MSYTINSLGGLQNLNGDGWERKVITLPELAVTENDDMESIIEKYRDWMLGGKTFEWRYHKDKLTGEIILERR